jgi:hypothetical protein
MTFVANIGLNSGLHQQLFDTSSIRVPLLAWSHTFLSTCSYRRSVVADGYASRETYIIFLYITLIGNSV